MTAQLEGSQRQPNFDYLLSVTTGIDLSNNVLSGPIPYDLDRLKGLQYLNISYNEFTGPIPISVGNLTSLESLDLSHNFLSGQIPVELGNLSLLMDFNLSYNAFSGFIPQIMKLAKFHDAFLGNPGLCNDAQQDCSSGGLAEASRSGTRQMEDEGFLSLSAFGISALISFYLSILSMFSFQRARDYIIRPWKPLCAPT